MHPRTSAAIVAGRVAGAASRASGRGGGTAVAGLVAQQIDPSFVERLTAQLGRGSVVVTGTNGKTTTARMVAAIAREAGIEPLANPSGSNLMRGVATALLSEAGLSGAVRDARNRLGVFEVDEATIPEAVAAIQPRLIAFTNLFRDQLDRYGEVDTVAALWRATVAKLPSETTIVLNADDPAVASLAKDAPCRIVTFGIEDTSVATEELEHASDYRFCLECGAELSYTAAFYGHVGHWRCASCGNARPSPDVRATAVALSAEGCNVSIATTAATFEIGLPMAGLYNAANALAAVAVSQALDIERGAIERALTSFRAAFGRQERFEVDGRSIVVLLGKNPTGMNQVLRLIADAPGMVHLLLFLNDGIQDGRDISWIWDTDYELLAKRAASVVVSGTRAEELALRLKYADFSDDVQLMHDSAGALDAALAATPRGETLYVVPTYTAMMAVRELLAKRGGAAHFWEEG